MSRIHNTGGYILVLPVVIRIGYRASVYAFQKVNKNRTVLLTVWDRNLVDLSPSFVSARQQPKSEMTRRG
jgi:hypothetical protein